MLFCLSYISRALVLPHSVDLLDIVRSSLRRNCQSGVCGALYFDEDQFFQTLEGPEGAVRETFERIRADVRHTAVRVLHAGAVAAPRFAGVPMKFVDGVWSRESRRLFAYDRLQTVAAEELDATIGVLQTG